MSKLFKLYAICATLIIYQVVLCHTNVPKPRIINGVLASTLSFLASVHVLDNAVEIRVCVGSVISVSFVLTSATCLASLYSSTWVGHVRAGSYFLHNDGMTRNFLKMIQHPEYNFTTRENDLLLIEVAQPFVISRYLNAASIDFAVVKAGARVSVAGWGSTSIATINEPSFELKVMSDETLNMLECQQRIRAVDIPIPLHYDDSICIRGSPEGSLCNYDYGAPLIHEGNIIGIWAWGPILCQGDIPYLFTRISPHINWISMYRGRLEG